MAARKLSPELWTKWYQAGDEPVEAALEIRQLAPDRFELRTSARNAGTFRRTKACGKDEHYFEDAAAVAARREKLRKDGWEQVR